MLVLAILLVMASLAWPRVEGIYERHRLRKAAEDVRAHLTTCRLHALNDGAIYQFRFQPGGRSYDVVPLASGASAVHTGMLPESISFAASDASTVAGGSSRDRAGGTNTTAMSTSTAAALGSSGQTSAAATVPILFLPDGTADQMSLYVVDDEGRRTLISIRGLTGAVAVSQVGREGR